MTGFLGVKNNRISIISDNSFTSDGLEKIKIPDEFSNLSPTDLLTKCKVKNGKVFLKHKKSNINKLNIAFIGNWKMTCGISTYAEQLWPELIPVVGDYRLFIEQNESATGPLNIVGDQVLSEDKIISCWARGESLKDLINEINKFNPDIVWIQHEFGLFPNARYWISLMNQLSDYRVIVTMHSVFHHKDKTICEAAIPEVVVHLDGAFNVLKKEKNIPGDVYVISHGCSPCANQEKLWNFYKSDQTFLQFGFGFRYKGWENSIKAVAILKEKYPNVFFTALFSESEHNKVEHQIYFNELMNLVQELNIQENVGIIRGFQSDETLNSYIRTNMATVFPYISHPQHEVYGASGAARMAMSNGIPVITSDVNHFSDLPSIKANSPEEIALSLEKVFTDSVARQEQINKQNEYVNENTWKQIALKYIKLFEK